MPPNQYKRQTKGTTPNKNASQIRTPLIGNKGGDMKTKWYYEYDKFCNFQAVCLDNKMSIKTNHVCIVDHILKGGFVAKARSLNPRPSFLYLKAQINGKIVLCTIAYLSMRSAQNIMSTKGTPQWHQDLWPRWWEGPSDPSVGGGPEHWERLPPIETKRYEDKTISYEYLMTWWF